MSNTNAPTFSRAYLSNTSNQLVLGPESASLTVDFPLPSTHIVLTMPSTSDTLVARNTVDSLSNKSLLAPTVINPIVTNSTGTLSLPTTTSTLLGSDHGTVTQLGSITNPVTLNTLTGIITTVSATTAAGIAQSFPLNNTHIQSTSGVLVSVVNYSAGYSGTPATHGIPTVNANGITNGQVTIVLGNVGVNPLAGTVQIGFVIL